MSDLLSIGASGVRAYQTALDTVGDNIANSGVAGYSRRSVSLREITVGSGTAAGGYQAGVGVLTTGIQRSSDSFAAAALRSADTDLTKTTTTAAWLDRIGKALEGNAIAARFTDFFNSSDALAADPASSALRANFLAAAGNVASAISATGRAFDQVDADLDAQAMQTTQTMNSLAASLVRINDGLGRTTPNTAASGQLLDQRDAILDQMSQISDLKVTTDNLGRSTVALGGGSGVAFVGIDRTNTLSFARNGGSVSFSVSNGATPTQLDPMGGSLAGYVEGAARATNARQSVEQIAADFTDGINTVQQAGFDLDGAPGKPLFTVGARATDLSIAPGITYQSVAAAGSDGGTPAASLGQRDATNLGGFEAVRSAKGFEAQVTGVITANAAQLKQRNTIAEAQTAIRTGAETQLSTATGVNLDSEAIDLMRFQQAYQASSRAIQVARDTLQTILDIR
jgi:flagellar hook-associated protein 1 FlgK